MNWNSVYLKKNGGIPVCLKAFTLNFIAVFFVYSTLMQPHFSPDTFAAYVDQYEQIYWQISLGRFIHGIVYHLLLTAKFGIIENMPIYTLLFMFISAWYAMRTASVLCSAAKKQGEIFFPLCNLGMLISIINICILEWYLFPEAMVMYSLALLGATEGALIFASNSSSPIKKITISFIWLFIGINSYQAILGWYVVLSLMIILARNDFLLNLRSFGMGCAVMGIGGINSLLNQLLIPLFTSLGVIEGSSRQAVISFQNLAFKLRGILDNQKDFFKNGYYLLPDYFLFGSFILGILLLLFALREDKFRRFISIGLALGTGYCLTLAPYLVSSSIRIAPRTLPPVFAILSLLIISSILCGNKIVRRIACLLSILILLVSSQCMSVIISDHMTTIHTDLVEGRAIIHEITTYEKETGITIEEICILPDKQMQFCYPGVKTMWMDINPRHMTVEWEREPFLEILSERNFTFVTLSKEEAHAIVQDRNWQFANYDEQIIFDGIRAYIILY